MSRKLGAIQVFRKFYSILVGQKNDQKVKGALEAQLRRHTETLVDTTMGPVVEYGRKIVESDPKGGQEKLNYIDFLAPMRTDSQYHRTDIILICLQNHRQVGTWSPGTYFA